MINIERRNEANHSQRFTDAEIAWVKQSVTVYQKRNRVANDQRLADALDRQPIADRPPRNFRI